MIVPTVFTAVDRYSTNVNNMSRATAFFQGRLASAVKTLAAYGEAAIAIEGVLKTGKEILAYETEIQNLGAVTGATGYKLEQFKENITQVAHETKRSAADVAEAFTNVDNNMPQLHDYPDQLAEVTKNSILLAKAARLELGPAAEFLTMSMNQFGLSADQAKMAVDALAGGAVAGSSKIAETAEALQVFGTVAANMTNATFQESVALVELVSKFEKGSEAGTKLRNILIDIANIKNNSHADEFKAMGVNLDFVSNKAISLGERLKEASKIVSSSKAMEDLFDKRNVAVAYGLLSSVNRYDSIYEATQKVGRADEMAAKNTDTLVESVKQLGAAFTTEIATAGTTEVVLKSLEGATGFLTNHMGGLLDIVYEVAIGYGIYKTAMFAATTATKINAFWVGVQARKQGEANIMLWRHTQTTKGWSVANAVMKLSMWETTAAVAGLSLVLGSLISDYNMTIEKQKILDGAMRNDKNGNEILPKTLSDKEVQKGLYKAALIQERKDINEQTVNEQLDKMHPFQRALQGLNWFDPEVRKAWVLKHANPKHPQYKQYGLDSTDAKQIQDSLYNVAKPVAPKSAVGGDDGSAFNFTINIDKGGNASVETPTGMNMPVRVNVNNSGIKYS